MRRLGILMLLGLLVVGCDSEEDLDEAAEAAAAQEGGAGGPLQVTVIIPKNTTPRCFQGTDCPP